MCRPRFWKSLKSQCVVERKSESLAKRSIYTQYAAPHHHRYPQLLLAEATHTSRDIVAFSDMNLSGRYPKYCSTSPEERHATRMCRFQECAAMGSRNHDFEDSGIKKREDTAHSQLLNPF